MFDPSSITVAFSAMKFATETLQSVHNLKVDVDSLERTNDALKKLGDAQIILLQVNEHLFSLQSENQELKNALNAQNNWDEKLANYELTTTSGGATIYKSREEPSHFICPGCINKNEIQILQDNRTSSGKYRCTGCTNEYPINQRQDLNRINYPRI